MPDVPYGYCQCGCGERTAIAKTTANREGIKTGEHRRFVQGHNSKTPERQEMLRLRAAERSTERFWVKVDRRRDDECWEWQGALEDGYGVLRRNGLAPRAHRFAYELLVGPIPDGLTLDHLCENTRCVNPAHLEPVMNGVNNLRGNSPWALNAKKTHCVNGHPLSGENLRLVSGGARACKTCVRENTRRWRARQLIKEAQ